MDALIIGINMISNTAMMWLFWLVVSVLLFFLVRACIRHTASVHQQQETEHVKSGSPR